MISEAVAEVGDRRRGSECRSTMRSFVTMTSRTTTSDARHISEVTTLDLSLVYFQSAASRQSETRSWIVPYCRDAGAWYHGVGRWTCPVEDEPCSGPTRLKRRPGETAEPAPRNRGSGRSENSQFQQICGAVRDSTWHEDK
jgi:hypothetical protein